MISLRKILSILALVALVSGCRPQLEETGVPPTPSSSLTSQPTALNNPVVSTTRQPEAGPAAEAFFKALQAGDYPGMYPMLDQASRQVTAEETFIRYLQDTAEQGMITGLDFELEAPESAAGRAQVPFRSVIHTALLGSLNNEGVLELVLEEGAWRTRWDPGVLLAQLHGGNSLKMEWSSNGGERGAIYAGDGSPLAAPADAAAVGIWINELEGSQLGELYSSLARLFGRRSATIQAQIEAALEAGDDYVALGEATAAELEARAPGLDGFPGVQVSPYHGRFYTGALAPHLTGYVGSIHSEDLTWYQQRGYNPEELVGQYGLEAWGESLLGGQRSGALILVDAQGQPVETLAELPAVQPQEIHTTINPELQAAAQAALDGFRGAAVVLERDTGRVLALASSPGFDPNAFAPANFNSYDLLSQTLSSPAQPLYNRAAEGQYPLGSVFKIITMAAALESGGYSPDTNYQCNYTFDELPGLPLHDWTWDHFQQDGETQPSGLLNLTGGLIRSCDPFFWHIGLDLYQRGMNRAVSDMARGFGLGSSTGLEGLADQTGNVPDPTDEVDALNLAIGQGNLQVTPLQVASFAAAVGSGGTLYRPQVIERIAPAGGEPSFDFEPQKRSDLPLKPETLLAIQEAMRGVVASKTPRGTAYHVFNGLQVPVAGKTGTSTTGVEPHAWFAGYTFAENPERPDIAIAVIVEHIGEGSDYAAPIFRRLVEIYFLGQSGKQLPWEKTGGSEKPGETPSEGTPPLIHRDP